MKDSIHWQRKDVSDVISACKSNIETGLDEEEAQKRVVEYGPNELIGFFTNKWLLLAITFTLVLQASAVYVPFLQNALLTTAMGW